MKNETPNHIWVKTPAQWSRVRIDLILYCCSEKETVTIYQLEGQQLKILSPLSSLEKKLASHNFFRCHRAYLVNIDYVEHFADKGLEAVMCNEVRIPVARNRKELFMERLMLA
jgi:Response regulator of the LytR/AlgR family